VKHNLDFEGSEFHWELDKIEAQVYPSERILILGDGPGDFVFGRPLVSILKTIGKKVGCAIEEGSVQDMSMIDIKRFGADSLYDEVVSTGTDHVDMGREEMSGIVRKCRKSVADTFGRKVGEFIAIAGGDYG